jgi:hypothetical protein
VKALLLCLVTFALLLTIGGCSGNTYNMRIVTYYPPTPPAADESLIYVFREDSSFGGMRRFAIIANDTAVASLTPGTFSQFKVKSGENEIVAYMTGPLMHYRVTPKPGGTVYLFCRMGYVEGMFMEEIDENTAKGLMASFKYAEIDLQGRKVPINYKDFYDNMYRVQ